jgi:hypothetical protein
MIKKEFNVEEEIKIASLLEEIFIQASPENSEIVVKAEYTINYSHMIMVGLMVGRMIFVLKETKIYDYYCDFSSIADLNKLKYICDFTDPNSLEQLSEYIHRILVNQ